MKILLTGTDGYIGSLLASHLLDKGHHVIGLDTGFYREGWLYNRLNRFPMWINKDIRQVSTKDLEGFDAFIHLAELSNDPLGELNPEITYEINHRSSVNLAKMCKDAGIERFVYTSSCSVYGIGAGEFKDETSELNPQTAYANCKVFVERDVSQMADDAFSPTFLRNATAYGASPRMRFDLVLNNLAGWAWTTKEIRMMSDGTPWRPLVHVLDICEAISCVLEAPRQVVHNQIYNVGSTEENYQVREVAEIVAEVFPGCELSIGVSDGDNRSYRVNCDKIYEQLPEFECRRDVAEGAEQLRVLFERINLTRELFEFRPYTRIKQLKHLLKSGQIDKSLFWRI